MIDKSNPFAIVETRQEAGVCEKHGDFMAEATTYGSGRKFGPRCPTCVEERVAEEARIEAQEAESRRRRSLDALLEASGIPKRFLSCTLDGYQPGNSLNAAFALKVSQKYTDGFQDRLKTGGSLVFCGLPGTGKTHLACAIGNKLLKDAISVKYATVFTALSNVKSTFSKNSEKTEREAMAEYQRPQLLILDEVGVQFGSDTEKIILYQIINGRYENMLPTIMISNLPEKELAAYIGDRCIDRMRDGGGAVISFDWGSHRK